jgi:hypothetical protein
MKEVTIDYVNVCSAIKRPNTKRPKASRKQVYNLAIIHNHHCVIFPTAASLAAIWDRFNPIAEVAPLRVFYESSAW